MVDVIKELRNTNITKTTHWDKYPAIEPTRPELNQAGRVVLITGGGTNIGFGIAQAFIRAGADTVVITGRRLEVLTAAASRLEAEAKTLGTNTKIIAQTCDVGSLAGIETFWKWLAAEGVSVDVFISNAAKFSEKTVPLLTYGADEVWSQVEANFRGPLYFTEKFYQQPGDKQKFIVNVSTGAIHATESSEVRNRPAYTLSKMSGTLLFQLLAADNPPEKLQIVNYNPGVVWNDFWATTGLSRDLFDSVELAASFAVWATSKEATFLHGRFVWASWDVQELATGEVRERIDNDFYYLKDSIVGIDGARRARGY